jgi:cell division protein FtsI/penicillin-binding protein 2
MIARCIKIFCLPEEKPQAIERTMKKKILFTIIAILLITACTNGSTSQTPGVVESTLPGPTVRVTQTPDAQAAADSYLAAWKLEQYDVMYEKLTALTKDAITFEEFEATHRKAAIAMTLDQMDYQILSALVNPSSAQVSYRVTYKTTLIGDITRDTIMGMALNNGQWEVQWEDGMILPELRGGNQLELKYKIPARGNIYDQDAHALVAQEDAVALGVVPGWINDGMDSAMVRTLANLTNLQADDILRMYEFAQADWYIPIGEVTAEIAQKNEGLLNSYGGVVMSAFRSRYYYEGGIAPHVVGYVLSIPQEKLEEYQRDGYRGDEKVGADGLEAWGEQYLAGKHGASLYVKTPDGQIVTMIASSESTPAYSIYTTIERDYQLKLQQSLGDYRGAIVVMEVDSGRVLAMVSNPTYDPNIFEPSNPNYALLGDVLNDDQLPMYNRAAQGVYPMGSVFKIITLATALETGVFTETSSYYCDSSWTQLEGVTLYDWTYEKELPPSGTLTLPEGLMRSCNPWFWHIGYELWSQGYTTSLADVARGFGLGSYTGIEIQDQAGNLETPTAINENVQLAIGQGTMQASPLQVARFIAAIANGGTLYRPGVVESIIPVDGGDPIYTFAPEEEGKLPVTQENLKIIQDAMRSVIDNVRGTAHRYLATLQFPVAGKTGTAQNPLGDSHAWFVGYTMQNDPERPDIAVVVLLENAGEGSEMASPVFRRAVSLYFSNNTNYGWILPWEASPYVVASPTPIPEEGTNN